MLQVTYNPSYPQGVFKKREVSTNAEELTAIIIGEIKRFAAEKSQRPNTVPTIEGARLAIPPTQAMAPQVLIQTKAVLTDWNRPRRKQRMMETA